MTTVGESIRPRPIFATRAYIAETARALDIADDTLAERIADHVLSETERMGGSDARLVFIADDGSGPHCSWCWAPSGLCPHIMGGQSEHVAGEKEENDQ